MKNSPAEVVKIDPADLEVANCYLQYTNTSDVANELEISPEEVSRILAKPMVKSYIDHVYLEVGFNNRFKVRKLLDTIITKKLEEMDAAQVGSNKDIMDILQMAHKMKMDELDKMIKLKSLETTSIKNQTNIQINETGQNYQSLLEKLLTVEPDA